MKLVLNLGFLFTTLDKVFNNFKVFVFPLFKPLAIVQQELGILLGQYLAINVGLSRISIRHELYQ